VIKARTCLIESVYKYVKGKGGIVVCSEAIETAEKLSIAPSKIDIFSRQDAPLSVPATSFLVAVASMTCQFVFGEFFLV
jgi:hypothetical protein